MRIISRLSGGLGNQMFQYAAGKALSQRYGAELLIDTTRFSATTGRSYGLSAFDISAVEAFPRQPERSTFRLACSRSAKLPVLARLLRQAVGIVPVVESRIHEVDPATTQLDRIDAGNIALDGYWQCPAYFAESEEGLRRDFTFKSPASGANAAMLDRIRASNAVSLHIRRGDYLELESVPVLPLAYYARAAEYIASRRGEIEVFVFSDDIAWTKANLRLPYPTNTVDINRHSACCEDLRLMSACKAHVIANSTFSWWGAWLNAAAETIVVAPKYWMCRPDTYFPGLFPPCWTVMDNLASTG